MSWKGQMRLSFIMPIPSSHPRCDSGYESQLACDFRHGSLARRRGESGSERERGRERERETGTMGSFT